LAKEVFCVKLEDMKNIENNMKKSPKICLSRYAGFCDGVRRAYEMVETLDISRMKKPVCMLGSLVHNRDVNKKIKKRGIQEISPEFFFRSRLGEIGTLIITAHGAGPNVFKAAGEKKIKVINATCPKVIRVQKLAETYSRRGNKIIIIGDRDHKEVKGIDAWSGEKCLIISQEKDLKKMNFSPKSRIIILSQTTQDKEFFKKTAKKIKEKYSKAKTVPTICDATERRQKEIKKLAARNDLILVIGGKESANSRRLFEIASKINPKTYFIENIKEIKPTWLFGVKKIAVSAGASTPDWIIKEIMDYLEKT
jgi:4-hydroxy-3-methylbut-2-enyl diphosphate reductase